MQEMIFENTNIRYVPGHNTFRLGSKWMERLKLDEVIKAVDLEGNVLGELMVRGLHFQRLDDALKQHATSNHGIFENHLDESPMKAREQLRRILESVYPNEPIDNSTKFTVVDFYFADV